MKKYNIGVVDIVLFFFTGGLWTLVILYKLWQNSQSRYTPAIRNNTASVPQKTYNRYSDANLKYFETLNVHEDIEDLIFTPDNIQDYNYRGNTDSNF